jgi:hypothetical protein
LKKWIALLIAALMMFSLTACGEKYDKEFTILVGGSGEWTPFENASGVTFANSDSKAVSVEDDGETVTFTGLAVGKSVITATYDGKTIKALVKVVKELVGNPSENGNSPGTSTPGNSTNSPGTNGEGGYIGERPSENGAIKYHYDPPENFYYEYAYYTKGESYEYNDIELIVYLDGAYTKRVDGNYYHYSGDSCIANGGDGWVDNQDSPDEVQDAIKRIKENPAPINYYYEIIDSSEAGVNIDINDYYVGNETVAGISCWVVDLGTYGGHSENYKFWINPANGHTLKMEDGDPNGTRNVYEVLYYDPDLKEWHDNWKP